MIVGSRWFPPFFAALNTVRHLVLVGFDYWHASRTVEKFDALHFIRADLARPLFESSEWCRWIAHHTGGQSAALGLDLPAYFAGSLLNVLMTGEGSCIAAMTTPRGNIIVTSLAFPIWFLVGLNLRRLAHGRLRRRSSGRLSRAAITVVLVAAIMVAVLVGTGVLVALLIERDMWTVIRGVGVMMWMLYTGAWASERLRLWPFRDSGKHDS